MRLSFSAAANRSLPGYLLISSIVLGTQAGPPARLFAAEEPAAVPTTVAAPGRETAQVNQTVEALLAGAFDDELEIIPAQRKSFDAILAKKRGAVATLAKETEPVIGNDGKKRTYRMVGGEKLTKLNNEVKDEAIRVLLPYQLRRWNQILFQARFSTRLTTLLRNEQAVKQLEMGDDSRKKLLDIARQSEGQLQKDIDELIKSHYKKCRENLTAAEKEKWDELFGEPLLH